jgi:hypothetical protein
MGFSEHFYNNISIVPDSYSNRSSSKSKNRDQTDGEGSGETGEASGSQKLSDQEILESIEAIYFTESVDTGIYELKVCFLLF